VYSFEKWDDDDDDVDIQQVSGKYYRE